MSVIIPPRSSIAVGISALRAGFAPSIPIASRAPQDWPRRWIRFSRVGGPKDWAIDRPFVLVECFASTAAGARDSVQAEADALLAYSILESCPGDVLYFEGGPIAELDDPDRASHARWQFTATIGVGIY